MSTRSLDQGGRKPAVHSLESFVHVFRSLRPEWRGRYTSPLIGG